MIHFLKFFARIYNRLFSKEKVFIKRLRGLIGFTPANLGIFKLAFYHKSTTSDKLYAIQSNERLEYLGDAVLATIVAEYLFQKYPNSDEGFLTKMRSKIVKRYSLNVIADKMGLDVFLNQYNNTRLSRSMLGNALEALVGAVYLEKGYNSTRKFVINRILLGYLDIHELESFDDNYKSQLLEWCQKNGKTVSYKMVSKYKFEKRDRFKVAVLIDGEKLAVADDFNKKSAEQTASERAMQILGILANKDGADNKNSNEKSAYKGGKQRNSRNRNQSPADRRRPDPKNRVKKDRPQERKKPERKVSANDSRNKTTENKAASDNRGNRDSRNKTADKKVKAGDSRSKAAVNKKATSDSRDNRNSTKKAVEKKVTNDSRNKVTGDKVPQVKANEAQPKTEPKETPTAPQRNARRNPNPRRNNSRGPRRNTNAQNRNSDAQPGTKANTESSPNAKAVNEPRPTSEKAPSEKASD